MSAEGSTLTQPPMLPGQPVLRWRSRARSIEEIETELARMWAQPAFMTDAEGDGPSERHVAARTSVMNLVVIARRPEIGEHAASVIQQLTGRHPSRTLIVGSADPDGPSWLDAQLQGHCILPREEAPETCAETIYLTCGGEAGRHLDAIVAPLLIHDLPVTIWWPDEPSFGTVPANELFEMGDRLVVDGSGWRGDGLTQLRRLAGLVARLPLAISDFALIRQSRWREAIASIFDIPDFLPYLRHIRRVAVTYAVREDSGDTANIVKPVYHVAWLASRLGMEVRSPLAPVSSPVRRGPSRAGRGRPIATAGGGLAATLRMDRTDVGVVVRPVLSEMPSGTTLRIELLAEWRGSELRADVTAEQDAVHARVWQDGVHALERGFNAPRRMEIDLLAESIEAIGQDPVATGAPRMAAELAGGPLP